MIYRSVILIKSHKGLGSSRHGKILRHQGTPVISAGRLDLTLCHSQKLLFTSGCDLPQRAWDFQTHSARCLCTREDEWYVLARVREDILICPVLGSRKYFFRLRGTINPNYGSRSCRNIFLAFGFLFLVDTLTWGYRTYLRGLMQPRLCKIFVKIVQ